MKRVVPSLPGLAGLAACLLAAATILFAPSGAFAQAGKVPVEQDTHLFRYLLGKAKLTGLDVGAEKDDPAHTLVIVLGKTDPRDQLHLRIEAFVEQGGALLVATDLNEPSHRLREPFQVQVQEGLTVPGENPELAYHGFSDCPFVKPTGVKAVPVFEGLSRVATNVPGYFVFAGRGLPEGLSVLARFPADAVPSGFPRWKRAYPFAIGGKLGKGRVLLLSDHSVFINCMMMPRDNDNFSFAANCVEWLCEGPPRRDRVLYVEDGKVRKDFAVNVRHVYPPIPPPEALLALGDRVLADLEDRGEFGKGVDSDAVTRALAEHVFPTDLTRIAAAVLTVGLLAFCWLLLVYARHRHETASPLLAQAAVQFAPAGAGVEERHRALLKGGNFWEAGRTLTRQFFEATAGLPAGSTRPPPRVLAKGGWMQRWVWQRRTRRWWELAYGRRTARVSSGQLARLAQQLNEAKAALAHGDWRFAEPKRSRQQA